MGGGHLTRPELGLPQADPAHPLTEFYRLLQSALEREGVFALPALYAAFQAPAHRIYAEEAPDYLALSPTEKEGFTQLLAPGQLQVASCLLCAARDGAPAALLLTAECSRTSCAVQLLPPFVWPDPLPPLPESATALTLQLPGRALTEIDARPEALGRALARGTDGKRWLRHPKADAFCAAGLARLQRLYRA